MARLPHAGRIFVALLACVGPADAARAGEPVTAWGGRLRLAGEVSGTLAPEDDGYFNYSDYEYSQLRLLRLRLAAELRPAEPAAILVELRSDNLDAPRLYALFLRLRPWSSKPIDLQVGLIPTAFGAMPRRQYPADNPLPGLPLAYQYLTALRSDSAPRNATELVHERARGWRVAYSLGSSVPGPGLPLVQSERWDTGAQLRLGDEPLSLALALTRGTLCQPLTHDDNTGWQLSGRLGWRVSSAWRIGLSGARGEYLADSLREALPPGTAGPGEQTAVGVDTELARGRWIGRGELVWSRWDVPVVDPPFIRSPLEAIGGFLEVRFKAFPGIFLAARGEGLHFGGVLGAATPEWDAPVWRLVAGAGWTPRPDLLVKLAVQYNKRDGGYVRDSTLPAVQVVWWF